IAECAANHHLLLDFHGMKPTGVQLAYPTILNFEAVKGLENSKWEPRNNNGPIHDQPQYDCEIPYLRMLPGAMDYTPGAMTNATKSQFFGNNDHPMSQGTRTHQVAMYTVFYAPLQMLADSPTKYMQNQECTDFIAKVPTTWDETIALDGKIGEYVAIARRKGTKWFIGVLNNWQEKDITLDLNKLNNHGNNITIIQDGINADKEATDYKKLSGNWSSLVSNNKITIHLSQAGGWSARIE
nr:glycoside hydrolase family 97 catalytic domain-containing protein [Prevotella sp.]